MPRKKYVPKWKKGDTITPKLTAPFRQTITTTIIEITKTGYIVQDKGSKAKENIEFKYLDSGYINENGERIYTWVLAEPRERKEKGNGRKNVKGKKDGKKVSKTD